jgi:hypothetical protein
MGYYLAMSRLVAWMAPLLLAQSLTAQPAPKQADLDKLFADAEA